MSEADGTETRFFVYRSIEISPRNLDMETLMAVLVGDKYPLAEQVRILTEGEQGDVQVLKDFKFECKKVAVEVLGLPVSNSMEKEEYSLVISRINARTDRRILDGFEWHGIKVWLSSENQFNFKAAYDIAVQTGGATLPVRFKLGEDNNGSPVYHVFGDMDEFTDFYTKALSYIVNVLNEGWEEKDSVNS